jgi:hypothetical protein
VFVLLNATGDSNIVIVSRNVTEDSNIGLLNYTFIFYLKNIFLTDILINIAIVQNLLPRLFIA